MQNKMFKTGFFTERATPIDDGKVIHEFVNRAVKGAIVNKVMEIASEYDVQVEDLNVSAKTLSHTIDDSGNLHCNILVKVDPPAEKCSFPIEIK